MEDFNSLYDKYLWIHEQKYILNRKEKDIAADLEIASVNSLRARYSQLKNQYGELPDDAGDFELLLTERRTSIDINDKGEIGSKRIIAIEREDVKNPRLLMEKHGFDPDEWDLIKARNEYWQSQRHHDFGGGAITLYLSDIMVKPKAESITRDSIAALFAELRDIEVPKIEIDSDQYDRDGYILEVGLADFHLGMRDHHGNQAGIKLRNTIADIRNRAKGKKFAKVALVLLGDTLHFDSINGTTSSGTQVSPAIGYREAFSQVSKMIVETALALKTIAPVEIIIVPGNHSELSEFHLCLALDMYFSRTDDITVDTEYKFRTWRRWGNVLVGWTHGNIAKTRLAEWLHQEARADFGKSKFAEIHVGHIHSEESKEGNGVILRRLPTMAPPDEWHERNGYMSIRRTVSFVWSMNQGLRDIWYTLP